jgi:hypothetical protein
MTKNSAAGASASLNKTISEIMKFLNSREPRPTAALRVFLREKIGDLGERWYRRGFNRGHRESRKQMRKGKVPRTLRYDATRKFFRGSRRTVRLKSVL